MTRKQLEDLGLSKEQVDGLKTQVSDRDRQLETLKWTIVK